MPQTVHLFILNCIFILSAQIGYAQPSNDDCANATLITTDSTCVTGTSRLTGQTLFGSTDQGYSIASSCGFLSASLDVWYKFVAKSKYPTITVSNLGSGWGSGLRIQLLSGSCGSFTEVACVQNAPLKLSLSNPLTEGNTYYIRIHRNSLMAPTGSTSWGFDICVTDPLQKGGRMNEVFSRTVLSAANVLDYPWEVTYGPDNKLWITEAKGYKVYRIDPNTGAKTTVLDLSTGSTFLPSPSDSLNAVNMGSWNPWPQGGFAGLAIHPQFGDGSGHDFVYVAYVHRFLGGTSPSGLVYRNKLVRFTYNSGTGLLGLPAVLCDTLPGSKDHNSQRMIIAPTSSAPGATNYLFYASGDMGSGQYENRDRPNKAQNPASYEGKILRFNLDTTGMPGPNKWIPNDNPYSSSSAVYSIGMRNNQGFAYDTSLNILYGSSHGPYSDDEINIIEPFRNYGHPLVIGFAADGNYNGTTTPSTNTSVSAGAPFTNNSGNSTCPPIGNELTNKAAIDATGNGLYKDPLFSAYPSTQATIANTWRTNPGNNTWLSEAWSGLDLYTNTIIPGWKRSLVASGLKWGRLIRLKLGPTGTTTLPSDLSYNNSGDTITYFQSTNRYRDLAFAPNGKDIYVIMDNSSATSGPGVGNPITPACPGCLIKYTFLGYADNGGKSTISPLIDVSAGTANACQNGTTITIDNSNNNLWVPITGADGNILAEIKANGNNLGTVTSSFYTKTGSLRETPGKKLYANRNVTITPQNQPSSAVAIRLYLTAAEFNALKTATNSQGTPSGVAAITDVLLLKNSDACGSTLVNSPATITWQYAETFGSNYVLQANITGFSTFYFAGANATILPVQLVTFKGLLQNNSSVLLQWETINEINASRFIIERSNDGSNFTGIGTVAATGNTVAKASYSFTDGDAGTQTSPVIFYRLKVIDNNGAYSYSKAISFTLNRKINVLLFPNPVKQILNIRLTGRETNPVTVQVSDLTGRVMYFAKRIASQNTNTSIDVKQWKPQVYVLKITNSKNELLFMQKFEKL